MDLRDEALEQRLGQTIAGRWILRRLIGSGGMAAVYAAENPEGQVAAIKLLYPEMGIRKDIRERFLREAAVMARVVHPGMVTIYEQGQSGDLAYLAMELLFGETVADRVRRQGRLDPNEVLVIVDQVLDVLVLAHSMGIVHRDLKPENLFLTQEGRVKVLDFGLARLLDAGPNSFRTRTGAALGTLPYMAPEQALGRRDEVDARTDIFAVGATAYRLLSGRRIHEAPSEAELLMCMASEAAKPLSWAAPDLLPDLGAVVDRALAFTKTSRYPDATTMQSDVRALLAGQPPAFAQSSSERDASATKVDRQAPVATTAAAVPPNSTRPLHAAAPSHGLPAPTAPDQLPSTAFARGASATRNDALGIQLAPASAPLSQRVPPATVVMSTTQQHPTSVASEAAILAAPVASIPIAPMSDTILERNRRRTLIVGLALLLGMLGVVTAAGAYLLLQQRAATKDARIGSPTPSNSNSLGVQPDDVTRTHARHPAHVMMPLEEPEAERRPLGVARAHRQPTPIAAASTTPPPSATNQVATPPPSNHQSNLVAAAQAVAVPAPMAPPATALGASPAPPTIPGTSPATLPPTIAQPAAIPTAAVNQHATQPFPFPTLGAPPSPKPPNGSPAAKKRGRHKR